MLSVQRIRCSLSKTGNGHVEIFAESWNLVRVRQCSDESGKFGNSFVQRLWRGIRGEKTNKTQSSKEASNGTVGKKTGEPEMAEPLSESGQTGLGESVVVVNPEDKFRQVLAVELNRRPLMPGTAIPVVVSNAKLIQELSDLKRAGVQAYVGAFLRKPTEKSSNMGKGFAAAGVSLDKLMEETKENSDPASHLYEVGTFAQVHLIFPAEGSDTTHLMLLGHKRIRRMATVSGDPLRVRIQSLKDKQHEASDHMKALTMEIISTMRELFHLHPLYTEQLKSLQAFGVGANLSHVSRLADIGAGITNAEDSILQNEVLEQLDVPERAQRVLELLKKEIELVKLQQQIGKQVEEKISKDQRRYFLMEQLKSIKKELGLEKDDKSALIQKFRERFAPFEKGAPKQAKSVIEEEIEKLSALEPASSEFNVTRNYLDWLTSIPWGYCSEEKLDVKHARQVLDEDHYGLEDVKDRILEFIAVGLLRGSTQGKILCLVGPPGVGKTSIGSSIAQALNRKYFRFSVGGLSDVAEIKGHRRTYVGAMPGKMVQCLKTTQTSNPLVLIDEVDKLGRGYQGDPASALLELLDPEQNSNFLDHYLDVPVDLSKVLFMCTANVLDTIPTPLLDRMEVIRLSGYLSQEKLAIARKYLEPQTMEVTGIPENSVKIDDGAMDALIKDYCREAGVRNLKNQLDKIYRKAALKLVNAGAKGPEALTKEKEESTENGSSTESAEKLPEEPSDVKSPDDDPKKDAEQLGKEKPKAVYEGDPIVVVPSDLPDYIGQPPFKSDKIYPKTPAGVVTGLAWTSMGGSILYAESAIVEKTEGKGSITCTGRLGEVMKESATIAHTYARSFLHKRESDNKFFSDSSIHIHFPEGATPKDGPSAGVTLVTSLLSLALDKPVKDDLAMTGEVSLTGRVLPIGGVKEKTIAARRSDIKIVVFPDGNRKDYDELDAAVKEGLTAHFVATYDDVFKLALDYSS